jgi:predicted nucleic acid-binding protein
MPLVIDASVMASWYYPDERNADAEAILARLKVETGFVPALWWFEIRNVLLTGERRGRTTRIESTAFLAILRDLPLEVALLPDEDAVMDLARRHRLTFYDAAYLELAKRETYILATFDRDLIEAARAEGVTLA